MFDSLCVKIIKLVFAVFFFDNFHTFDQKKKTISQTVSKIDPIWLLLSEIETLTNSMRDAQKQHLFVNHDFQFMLPL